MQGDQGQRRQRRVRVDPAGAEQGRRRPVATTPWTAGPSAGVHGGQDRGDQSPLTRRTPPTTLLTSGTCGCSSSRCPPRARRRAGRGGRPAARRHGQPGHHRARAARRADRAGRCRRHRRRGRGLRGLGGGPREGWERARGRGELSGIRQIAVGRGDGRRRDDAPRHRHRPGGGPRARPRAVLGLATAPGSLTASRSGRTARRRWLSPTGPTISPDGRCAIFGRHELCR